MNLKYRKTIIAGNWKMNKTITETKEYAAQMRPRPLPRPLSLSWAAISGARWCCVSPV